MSGGDRRGHLVAASRVQDRVEMATVAYAGGAGAGAPERCNAGDGVHEHGISRVLVSGTCAQHTEHRVGGGVVPGSTLA